MDGSNTSVDGIGYENGDAVSCSDSDPPAHITGDNGVALRSRKRLGSRDNQAGMDLLHGDVLSRPSLRGTGRESMTYPILSEKQRGTVDAFD